MRTTLLVGLLCLSISSIDCSQKSGGFQLRPPFARNERQRAVKSGNRRNGGNGKSVLRHALDEGASGGMAGLVQVLTMMWLRTTVNYQYRYGVSLQVALVELYKQGGVPRFYKGLPYAMVQGPLCKFGAVLSVTN